MTSWHDDFKARVDYAARVISEGRATSRKFDSTCENNDGDAVVAALLRRAEKNDRLRANLPRYIDMDGATMAYEKFKGQDLAKVAAAMRLQAKMPSKDKMIGSRLTFAYPKEFTTLPDYTAHAGQPVVVLRRLTDDEADPEIEMYEVKADDGWIGHADFAELAPLVP